MGWGKQGGGSEVRRPVYVRQPGRRQRKAEPSLETIHLSVWLHHQVPGKRGIALDRVAGVKARGQILRGVIHNLATWSLIAVTDTYLAATMFQALY